MSLIQMNLNPSRRDLRIFGMGIFPGFFALIGLMAWRIFESLPTAIGIWSVALVVTLSGLVFPTLMRAVYVVWMVAAYPIGWTISHLLFVIAFYGLITPVAVVMRWAGRDALKLDIDKSCESYWTPRKPAESIDQYFRQF